MNKTGVVGIALSLVVAASIASTAFADGWGTTQGSDPQWQGDGNNGWQYGQSGDSNGPCWGQSGACDRDRGQVGWIGDRNDRRGSWRGRRWNGASGYDGGWGGARCQGSDRFGCNRQTDRGWGDRRGWNGSGWEGRGRSTYRWNGGRQDRDDRDGRWNDDTNYGR